jgi:uncharacterized protein YjiS (DUF1127 family)
MLRQDCIDTISVPVARSGMSNSWKSWIAAGITLLAGDVARVFEILKVWQQRNTGRIRLRDIDERMLRDIGITRQDALREFNKPFWRD